MSFPDERSVDEYNHRTAFKASQPHWGIIWLKTARANLHAHQNPDNFASSKEWIFADNEDHQQARTELQAICNPSTRPKETNDELQGGSSDSCSSEERDDSGEGNHSCLEEGDEDQILQREPLHRMIDETIDFVSFGNVARGESMSSPAADSAKDDISDDFAFHELSRYHGTKTAREQGPDEEEQSAEGQRADTEAQFHSEAPASPSQEAPLPHDIRIHHMIGNQYYFTPMPYFMPTIRHLRNEDFQTPDLLVQKDRPTSDLSPGRCLGPDGSGHRPDGLVWYKSGLSLLTSPHASPPAQPELRLNETGIQTDPKLRRWRCRASNMRTCWTLSDEEE